MPSRRDVLGGLASAALVGGCGSLAGCLSTVGLTERGYVQLKTVLVRDERDGTQYSEDVIRVWPGREDGTVRVMELMDDYRDRFSDPKHPTVSESLHRDLTNHYEEVHYLVGVCGPAFEHDDEYDYGCRNTWTSREDFNRVQLYDDVEVWLRDDRFSVQSVDGRHTFTPGA